MRRRRPDRHDFDCHEEDITWGERPRSLAGRCVSGARVCLRTLTVVGLLLAVFAGIVVIRLAQGPVALPALARVVESQVNARIGPVDVSIGDAVFTLSRDAGPSGLLFTDVAARDASGRLLLSAPRVFASLHAGDLLLGRIQPTRLSMVGPRVRILRAMDGRVLFGLGREAAPRPVPRGTARVPGEELADPAEAVARTIRGFVGDEAPVPVLEKLGRIAILNADIEYRDARTGSRWRTRGSDLQLFRTDDGARAVMRAALDGEGRVPARVRIEAHRTVGSGRTTIAARVHDLRPDAIAADLGVPDWVGGLAVPVSGVLGLQLGEGGAVSGLSARLEAGPGTLATGTEAPIRVERLVLRVEQEGAAYRIDELSVAGPDVAGEITGTILPDRAASVAAVADLHLTGLDIDMPELFAEPVSFASGQATLRADPAARRLDIAALHLTEGPLTLSATGRLRMSEGGLHAGLRARGTGLTVAGLKAHWPLVAAPNPRAWVDENLVSGRIPELVAQIGLRPGRPPDVALDFTFEDVASRYLAEMPPIEGGKGTGHLTLDGFDLSLATGTVTPPGGRPIEILPSRLSISALTGEIQPADITLSTEGRIDDVLALIDHAPLGLMAKLGVPLGPVAGRASIATDLNFPLLNDLLVEDVGVAAEAGLSGVALEMPRRDGRSLAITAERLALRADAERLSLGGAVEAAGVPLDVRWQERYGAGPGGRTLEVSGRLTPAFLAAQGVADSPLKGGEIPLTAVLEAEGDAGRLSLDADLGPSDLAIDAIGLAKPSGAPGRLSASGTTGDGLSLERFAVVGGGLAMEGSLALDAEGGLRRARISRFALADRADLQARIDRGEDGGYVVSVEGPFLDLSETLTDPPEAGRAEGDTETGPAVALEARIDRLLLTPKLAVEPVSGRLRRRGNGETTLALSGRAGGRAPFEGAYRSDPGHDARLRLNAPDAGAFLGAMGLFEGASGGSLTLDAALAAEGGSGARGKALIEGMAVRRAATFGSILEEGGVEEAAEAVATEGIVFSSIEIPFTYVDGVIELRNAIARSPVVALKVEGEVEEAANRLDLRGVLSPAYAITGALDNVPVLGRLLSGGEGEGILAMTFRVGGTLDAPDFSVNPLSLLAPGFLRTVFTSDAGPPASTFTDRIERGETAR